MRPDVEKVACTLEPCHSHPYTAVVLYYMLSMDQVKDELLPEAKEEYANVLEDTRHPANKEAFKPEDLRRARDEAKAEVER